MGRLLLLLFLFSFTPAGAQTFTQRLQKQVRGEGTVTVHQDKAIDDLVNGPQPVLAPVTTTKPDTNKEKSKEHPKEKKETAKTPQADAVQPQGNTTQEVAIDTLTVPKKPSRFYKTTGYRVQVFAGGNSRSDKQKAERIGGELRALFPLETVYTHFYSPRWICRIGNYKTYEEAHKMLHDVRELGYSSATIVKGKISLPLE